uniref:Uncharacterized protein n=1 Tax=Oryza barthii TaxID=65489 RepID=A0A0D3FSN1_9ORYZ
MVHQIYGLELRDFNEMSSRGFFDARFYDHPSLGHSTQPMFTYVQVKTITLHVFISTPMATPPVYAENEVPTRESTSMAPEMSSLPIRPVGKSLIKKSNEKINEQWCPIQNSNSNAVEGCRIIQQLKAELDFCNLHKIQRASPYKQSDDPQVGDNSSIESERVVGYIGLDPHKLSVLHGLDDHKSSGSNSICDVSMINGRFEDREEDGHNIEYVEINS